ncbi:MAG: TIGR03936 family radical SAM-associated protein [Lachnospiraceae bacterium]|nr:TIGR03936 family radical SAM-associated protein [Lachnospiraceae bacterium]
MKIRIKFKKWGCMKFIGHLDMLRYFQKAMRRAEIDICYSEGFSPHQIMSFAAPLGVGITSDGEYFDIEVNSTTSTKEALQALNATMVDGVEVTGYVKLPDNAKTAMSIVTAADYYLTFKEQTSYSITNLDNLTQNKVNDKTDLTYQNNHTSPYSVDEWNEKINECFTSKDTFTIIKKTKKSEKEIDLKPLVYEIKAVERDGKPAIFICVSTGSTTNIKPELVLASIYEKLGIKYDETAIAIHRNDVYTADENGAFISLLEQGTII